MTEVAARIKMNSPVGMLAISATENGVCSVDFIAENGALDFADSDQAHSIAKQAVSQLQQYFAGELTKFSLPLDLQGTDFQRAVWAEIANTDFGVTQSYGEIANKIGKPAAARAVGGAVGANPVPIIVGCHRIMGSTGKLTGYSGGAGLRTKIKLLELEGITYR